MAKCSKKFALFSARGGCAVKATKPPVTVWGEGSKAQRGAVVKTHENGYATEEDNSMQNRWKSLARCAEGMLSNFAVVGIGLALYEQKWWPALAIGTGAAVAALIIAWSITHD